MSSDQLIKKESVAGVLSDGLFSEVLDAGQRIIDRVQEAWDEAHPDAYTEQVSRLIAYVWICNECGAMIPNPKRGGGNGWPAPSDGREKHTAWHNSLSIQSEVTGKEDS